MFRTAMLGSWLLATSTWDGMMNNADYKLHISLYKTKQRPILRGGQVYVEPFAFVMLLQWIVCT